MMFGRVVLVNVVMTAIAGLLVGVAVLLFEPVTTVEFVSWLLQALGLLIFGLIVQNLMHMKWLQQEHAILRWSSGDSDDFLRTTIDDLIQFPLKAVTLAIVLWLLLGAVAAWLYLRQTGASWGGGVVVYVFVAASGLLASELQIFFYRRILFGELERFLTLHGERLSNTSTTDSLPFTVRAKLLLQSCFSLLAVLVITLAAGYGVERDHVRSERERALSEHLALALPVLRASVGEAAQKRVLAEVGRVARAALAARNTAHGGLLVWAPNDLSNLAEAAVERLSRPLANRTHVALQVEDGDWRLAAVAPLGDGDGPLGYYLYIFFLSTLGGGALIFLISFLASHELSRSVNRVQKWAEQLGRGILGASPRITEDDEVADLILRLDALRGRLSTLLSEMQAGTQGTRTLSGRVQEHAVYLRQTIEEDANLLALTAGLLEQLEKSLREHQRIVNNLTQANEETMSGSMEMGVVLRELDGSSNSMNEIVAVYKQTLEELATLVQTCRADLDAFVQGAEEARRSLVNLDDVLDHLVETVRRSQQAVLRTAEQSGEANDTVYAAQAEIQNLEAAICDSAELIEHLGRTMSELRGVASGIHEVAEDTKLLSLNASIRSVKAREEGRSFAVISHTIQELADQTQRAIGLLQEQIDSLLQHAVNLDNHVEALMSSLHDASTQINSSAHVWRETRTTVGEFRALEEQFEVFVQELRMSRDSIRQRQGSFESQAQLVTRLLGNLLGGLEQRMQQIRDVEERTAQIRHYSSYQVSKGRFVADHVDQIRSMSLHVHSFVVEQLRSLNDLSHNIQHLRGGMQENVGEAKEISDSLKRLERSIRRFQDAFGRFHIREVQR